MLKWFVKFFVPVTVRKLLSAKVIYSKYYSKMVDDIEKNKELSMKDELHDDEYWATQLRKYAHIIDKGLQRCDSEAGHSKEFYNLALDALSKITSSLILNDPSVLWAKEKLKQYEELQMQPSCHPVQIPNGVQRDACPIIINAIKERRSIRIYSKTLIPDELVHRIAEGASWAPSSCNRQATKIFATIDPNSAKKCMATCSGATGFSDFIPCFITFGVDMRSYILPQEHYLPVIDAALGAQNCCLIAHSFGLSLTFLNWTHQTRDDDLNLRSILNIPAHYQIVLNGTIGYPKVLSEVPARKDISQVLSLK